MDPEYFALSLFEKAVLQNQSTRYNPSDIEETLNSAADYAKQANPVRQDILKVINELKEKL